MSASRCSITNAASGAASPPLVPMIRASAPRPAVVFSVMASSSRVKGVKRELRYASVLVDVELRHLRYFVAVAEEASFTAAARRVHVAQQVLSAQVRQLEGLLGVDLLERSTRG